MKSIERRLRSYLGSNTLPVGKKAILDYAEEDPNDAINTLFNCITEELNKITGREKTHRINEVIGYIPLIVSNVPGVDRKLLARKFNKMYERIEAIKREKRNKFDEPENAIQELNQIQQLFENLNSLTETTETKSFDSLTVIIDIRNLDYIEFILNQMPKILNIKDKDNKSLFRNIVQKYIEACIDVNEDDILYFNNIICLMFSKKEFELSPEEKKETLELLYKALDQLSVNKKTFKKNKFSIDKIQGLIDFIKAKDEPVKGKANQIELLTKKYDIHINFDQSIYEQAKLARVPKEGTLTDRKEISDYIITIDGDSSYELDDGLSCIKLPNGNYLLGVHTVSILGYFPYDSEIVQEALFRCRNIYLGGKGRNNPCHRDSESQTEDYSKMIPIFPLIFSTKIASLCPGERRLARSYYFEINKDGEVVDEKFIKTIIRSSRRTTYGEINNIIVNGTSDERLNELVNNLKEVTMLLDKKIKPSDLFKNIQEATEGSNETAKKNAGAKKIVSQAMTLCGIRVAEFFAKSKRHYPFIYRVHEVNPENLKKIEKMVKELSKTYGGSELTRMYRLIGGIYPKGWYATEGKNSVVGVDHYSTCTSGLRRGADIIAEHALEVCYDQEPTDEEIQALETEIAKRIKEMNVKDPSIEWFSKEYRKIKRR